MKKYVEINCRKKTSSQSKELFYRESASITYSLHNENVTIELIKREEVKQLLRVDKQKE